MSEYVPPSNVISRTGAGVVGGIAGGVVLGIILQIMGFMPQFASLVGHDTTGWAWISPTANMTQVANAFFRLAPAYDVPWPVSFALLSAIVVASSLVLERRVRAVEVVA